MTKAEKFVLKRRLRDCYSTDKSRVYEIAEREIDRIPTTEIEGRWIPVIEKLPKKGQKVLCCVTNEKHSVVIMYFEDASYWHDGKISAWMPCPEPYGGDV